MFQLAKYSYDRNLVRFKASITVMLLLGSSRGDFRSAVKVRSCNRMVGNISTNAMIVDTSDLQILLSRCCSPLAVIRLWSAWVIVVFDDAVKGGTSGAD